MDRNLTSVGSRVTSYVELLRSLQDPLITRIVCTEDIVLPSTLVIHRPVEIVQVPGKTMVSNDGVAISLRSDDVVLRGLSLHHGSTSSVFIQVPIDVYNPVIEHIYVGAPVVALEVLSGRTLYGGRVIGLRGSELITGRLEGTSVIGERLVLPDIVGSGSVEGAGVFFVKSGKPYFRDESGNEWDLTDTGGGSGTVVTTNPIQGDGSPGDPVRIAAASAVAPGYLTASNWNTFNGKEEVLSFNGPLNRVSNTVSIAVAGASQSGYLKNTDWVTFNGKENVLTFTTPLSRAGNTISIPSASGSVSGYLSSADWTTFNNKLSSVISNSPLSGSGTVGSPLSIQVASSSQSGYLSNTDWAVFNNKESPLSFSSPLVRSSNTISIPMASTGNNGYLSSVDWNIFDGKENALTFTAPISRVGNTVGMPASSSSSSGYLTSTDWNTFNSKEEVLSFSTPLKRIGNSISIDVANSMQSGYLGWTDWVIFNNKEEALTFVDPLSRTGNVVSVLDASGVQRGVVNGGVQSFAGIKTFNSVVRASNGIRFKDLVIQEKAARLLQHYIAYISSFDPFMGHEKIPGELSVVQFTATEADPTFSWQTQSGDFYWLAPAEGRVNIDVHIPVLGQSSSGKKEPSIAAKFRIIIEVESDGEYRHFTSMPAVAMGEDAWAWGNTSNGLAYQGGDGTTFVDQYTDLLVHGKTTAQFKVKAGDEVRVFIQVATSSEDILLIGSEDSPNTIFSHAGSHPFPAHCRLSILHEQDFQL